MVVIVEDLVVIARVAPVPPDKNRVGSIDHYLPDVIIGQQRSQWSESNNVAHRPFGHSSRVRKRVGSPTPGKFGVPTLDLFLHQLIQRVFGTNIVKVDCELLGSLRYSTLNLNEWI